MAFDKPSVLLAPGAITTAHLLLRYADGSTTPIEIPDGTTLITTGHDAIGGATVADGGIAVTAGSEIGTMGITLEPADLDLPIGVIDQTVVPFYLQTARLAANVRPLTNDEIAFPAPGLDTADGLTEEGLTHATGYTSAGIGTFGWDAIIARSKVEHSPVTENQAPAQGLVVWIPLVVYGDAPATGTKVAAVEGVSVLGTVVEPDGLPTLAGTVASKAAHLVTVQLTDATTILADYRFTLTDSDLATLGQEPTVDYDDLSCPAEDGCPDQGTGGQSVAGAGRNILRAVSTPHTGAATGARPAAADDPTPDPTTDPGTAGDAPKKGCKPTGSFERSDFTFGLTPSLKLGISDIDLVITDQGLQRAAFIASLDASITGTVGMVLGAHAKGGVDCTVADTDLLNSVIFPAPASLLFTPQIASALTVSLSADFRAGVTVKATATMSYGFSGTFGYLYENGGGNNGGVNTIAPKASNWSFTRSGELPDLANPDDAGQPVSADLSAGIYWQPSTGVKIGGNLTSFLEKVKNWSWFSQAGQDKIDELLAKAKINILKGKIGPTAHLVAETPGYVLVNQAAGTRFGLEATGKLELTAADLTNLLAWTGLKVTLSLTLVQVDLNLAMFLQHRDGSPQAVVDSIAVGNDAGGKLKTVKVQPRQHVTIKLPTKVAPNPLGNVGSTTLQGVDVYEPVGPGWERSSKLHMTVSGVEANGELPEISLDDCRDEWSHVTFALLPVTPGLFTGNWPGWGGLVTVECSVPELSASHDGADIGDSQLEADDGGSIAITVHGINLHKAYQFTATPSESWLTVKPNGHGTIGPSEDADAAGGTTVPAHPDVDLTLDIDCGALTGDQQASVKISADEENSLIQSITIPVTAHCTDTLTFDPDTLNLNIESPGPVTAVLTSESATPRDWTIGELPNWLIVGTDTAWTPTLTGTFDSGVQTEELTLRMRPETLSAVTCDPDGTRKVVLTATATKTNQDGSTDHKSTTNLTVVYRCKPPTLKVSPAAVVVHRGETVPVTVIGSSLSTALPVTASSTLSGLSIFPGTVTVQPGAPDSAPVQISLSCNGSQRQSGQLTVTAGGPDPKPAPVSVPVRLLCDTQLTLVPSTLTGRNAVATLAWEVGENKTLLWTMKQLPSWLVANPVVGDTPDAGQQESGAIGLREIHFAITGIVAQACNQPEKPYQTTIEITGYEDFPDGGGQVSLGTVTATYTYTQPAGPPCNTDPRGPTAGGAGDPHMGNFNGTRYDAQVIGEYTYLTPKDAGTDGPVLQVRHEPTGPGTSVTSITAIALATDGHVLQVYARPDLGAYLDGTAVELAENVPVPISASTSLVRSGSAVTISGPGLSIVLGRWKWGDIGNFDLSVRVPMNSPVWGLLGSPTGDPDDDRLRSDGVVEDNFNWVDAAGHAAIQRFTDSWRVTDPAEALLTARPSGAFAEPNPEPISAEDLAANRALIAAAIPTVCGPSADLDRVENELAVELWARGDGDVSAVIAGNTALLCRYYVSGTVTLTDGEASSTQAGLRVTVEVEGTSGCRTATAADGHYSCVLAPDPTGSAPSQGPAVTVTVLAPGGTEAIGAASAAFPAPAPMGSWASTTVDVAVPADRLPTAALSGTLINRDGTGMTGPVKLCVAERKGDGSYAASRTFAIQPDPATGEYQLVVRLSEAPAGLRLTSCGNGFYDWGFATKDVTLDGPLTLISLSYSVAALPALVVSGTLVKDGHGNTTPLALCLVEYQGSVPVFFQDNLTLHPDAATGYYRLVVPLYSTPTSTRVSTCGGSGTYEDWGQPGPWQLDVPAGATLIPLAISFDSDTLPTVTVSGHIKADGHGADPLKLDVLEDLGTGGSTPVWGSSRQVAVTPDPATGAFSVKLWLWNPPKHLWLVPAYPASLPGWDYNLPQVFDLADKHSQAITLDYDVAALPTLTIHGVIRSSSITIPASVQLTLAEQKADGSLYTRVITVNPAAADGTYSITVPLYVTPLRAVKVWSSAPALAGFLQANATFVALDPGAASQTITVNYQPDEGHTVTLTGHLTRNGAGIPGPVVLCVQEQNPAGQWTAYRNVTVTPDPATGAFTSDPLVLLERPYRQIAVARCGGTSFQNAFIRFERDLDPDVENTVVTIEFDDSAQGIRLFDASTIPSGLASARLSYGFMKGTTVAYATGPGLGVWPALNLLDAGDLTQIGKTIPVDAQYDAVWYRVEWVVGGVQHEVTGEVPVGAGLAAVLPDPWHAPPSDGPTVLQLTQADDPEYRQRCGDDRDHNQSWCSAYDASEIWIYQFHDGQQVSRIDTIGTYWQSDWTAAFWLTLRPGTDRVDIRYENGFLDADGVSVGGATDLPGGKLPIQIPAPRPPTSTGTGQLHLAGEWADWQHDLGWPHARIGVLAPDPDDEHRLVWAFGSHHEFFPLDDKDSWPDGVTGTVDDDGYDLWIDVPGSPEYAWLAFMLPDWDFYSQSDKLDLSGDPVELELPEMDTVTVGGVVNRKDGGPAYLGDAELEVRLGTDDDADWDELPIEAYVGTVTTDSDGRFAVTFGVPHDADHYQVQLSMNPVVDDYPYGHGVGFGLDINPSEPPDRIDETWLTINFNLP